MNKTQGKTQQSLNNNPHIPQETINNTPSKNDQETHFFTVSFVYKPIQTPSNWSKMIGNDRKHLKVLEQNQRRSRKSKTIKSDQKRSRTLKNDQKWSKKSKNDHKFFKLPFSKKVTQDNLTSFWIVFGTSKNFFQTFCAQTSKHFLSKPFYRPKL